MRNIKGQALRIYGKRPRCKLWCDSQYSIRFISELLALAANEPIIEASSQEAFCPLVQMPGFEINRSGVVRRRGTGRIAGLYKHINTPLVPYVRCYCTDKVTRSFPINVLLEETFGQGAAEAAGYPAPDMRIAAKNRARSEKQRQEKQTGSAHNRRKCTTCGKPTYNYRCDACWRKVRGFGTDEAVEKASPFDGI